MKTIPEIKSIRKQYKVTNYCLPMHTQILTKQGWKTFDQIRVGESLPVYNQFEGVVQDGFVVSKHFYQKTPVVKCYNSNTAFVCTSNHKWYSKKRVNTKGTKGYYKSGYTETKDLNTEDNLLMSAPYKGDSCGHVTGDEALLMGFILSDGYYRWSDDSQGPSTSFGKRRNIVCMVSQSKNKFSGVVESCLERLGLNYRKDVKEVTNGNTVFSYYLRCEEARDFFDRVTECRLQKHEMNWTSWVMKLSRESLKAFYKGFFMGDGTQGQKLISQNEGNVFDAVVAVTQLLGKGRVLISGNGKCRHIRMGRSNNLTWQKVNVEEAPAQDTFCLTTNDDSFIIRQGDFVGITGNSAIYGVGVAKLARELGISRNKAKELLDAYWKRNWSVKEVVKKLKTKVVNNKTWVQNPVSGFWHELRFEKDKFSTLNQSTGVYLFDSWVARARVRGVIPSMQFHDEIAVVTPDTQKTDHELLQALDKTNRDIKLNVTLSIDVKAGNNYAEVH
jgi:hypothetical protein